MRVIDVDPISDRRWHALLDTPGAGLFHAPPWMQTLHDTYGLVPRAHVAVEGPEDTAVGGVAYCEVDDALGARTVSLPFSDACDPLLRDPAAWPALLSALARHGRPVLLRCLDERLTASIGPPSWQVVKRARWHTLALSDSPDASRRRFTDAARRAVARAERLGMEVRPLPGPEGARAFWPLHVALRKRKYRLLAQPLSFFVALAERFGAHGAWHAQGAYHRDRLVAATIYLRWGDTLYYKFNASDPEALRLRPNNLLVWAGVQLAGGLGCRALDLGPSDDDQPGLIRFKRGFGAAERELRVLRLAPPDALVPGATPLREALATLTAILTAPDVPDETAGAASAAVYRFFA